MSLKIRLLASLAALLVLALLLGGALLGWQARKAVRDEIHLTFQGAAKMIQTTMTGDVDRSVAVHQLITTLDDQRSVRAFVLDDHGNILAGSRTAAINQAAPGWFTALMEPSPLTARIVVIMAGAPRILLLKSDAGHEIGEIWQLVRDAFAAMTLFSASILLFVWLIVDHSLGFFRRFQKGLGTISEGDYDARLAIAGPPEFISLAEGFNHMAAQLAGYRESNLHLQKQILSLQEEERAEIARDLHDEVGPYLFAIQVDADALAKSGNGQDRERAGAIREATQHIQHHVKSILRQLRPVRGLDFGLETAIDDMISFWKRRHPEIHFERKMDFGIKLGRRGEETAYRIVQESVSNAVRHALPHKIRIVLANGKDCAILTVEDDGQGFGQIHKGATQSGMGLKGMAERVRALNGRFTVENLEHGVRVRAVLPCADTREMEEV